MPRYEFLCEKCQKPFELTMTISEHEKGKSGAPPGGWREWSTAEKGLCVAYPR